MPLIEVESLNKSFGKKKVLNDLSFSIEDAGIVTILGPNASGKTTLIKSILGMVFPDKGSIHIDGLNIKGEWEYKSAISYLPQIAQFPENLKVKELIDFIQDIHQKSEKIEELIDLFGLKPYLNDRISILSGGTKQKVNTVIAFMYDNPLYILDEPTNGLDPIALIRLKELITKEKENGKCILITTHIMSLVEELSDDVIYMLEGNIHFRGSVSQLKSQFKQNNVESAIAAMLELSTSNESI